MINIQTNKRYRVLTDATAKIWSTLSFWSKASDTEFDNGKNLETTCGSIYGITDSLTTDNSNYAASAKAIKELNSSLSNINLYVGTDKKLHWVDKDGADSVLPFSAELKHTTFNVTQARSGYNLTSDTPIEFVMMIARSSSNSSYMYDKANNLELIYWDAYVVIAWNSNKTQLTFRYTASGGANIIWDVYYR